jgi:hypothetical protein
MARLLREYGPECPVWVPVEAQIGACPKREAHNIGERCSVYCPDLVRLFFRPTAVG